MARRAAERLVWTVERMNVGPTDRLLEIGCGHGVAVSLVCDKLGGEGRIVAIDRSEKMIAAARRRNAACEARGGASFRVASLDEADFGDARFDKVFAIHIGVFLRGEPSRELDVIRGCLAPTGRLYLVDEPLDRAGAERSVERYAAALDRSGFAIVEAMVAELPTTRIACVVAGVGMGRA